LQQQYAMKQNSISILSTRPLDELLISKAVHKSIFIESATFIETEPVTANDIIQQVKALGAQNICAVFTSMNAADAVIGQLTEMPGWRIFCLGGVTKEHITAFFGKERLEGTAKNASALCERIVAAKGLKEVVFFCGDHRLDELPETLRRHNISVQELIVYNTIQTPRYVEKDYDAIMFFSPSAVHSFFSLNTLPLSTVLFAIGKTTAATVHTYCTNTVITSEWPGKEHMVDLVIDYFTGTKDNS